MANKWNRRQNALKKTEDYKYSQRRKERERKKVKRGTFSVGSDRGESNSEPSSDEVLEQEMVRI